MEFLHQKHREIFYRCKEKRRFNRRNRTTYSSPLVLSDIQQQETEPGPTWEPMTGPIIATDGFTPILVSINKASSFAPA